jgi:hypothetical protein
MSWRERRCRADQESSRNLPHFHDAGSRNHAMLGVPELQVHAAPDEGDFEHRATPR